MERYPDVIIEELSTQVDHVHMMLVIPPKYAVSKGSWRNEVKYL